ncbi:MAG: hypothetical protein EON90_05365 [Brevundimonas sp.]|nr:MAG: hypothetical protein EON90_05365 [Brevundimonas sp.]
MSLILNPCVARLAGAGLVVSAMTLASCGEQAAKTAAPVEAEPPRIDPVRVIHGVVTAPQGVDLTGAVAVACLTPRETCAQEAQAELVVQDGVGRYELIVPAPGQYHVMIWKDGDGDGKGTAGDVVAFANNMEPVASGQSLTPMTAFVRTEGEMDANLGGAPMGAQAEMEQAAAAVRTARLGGRWSQASNGTELVWGPEIKFQPAISSSGFGTDLGGTFGPGSQTNTTIVYSYKPMQVRRSMTLDVHPDGSFHWVITQQRRNGKCRTVRQEKFGRLAMDGERLILAVADARQSCAGAAAERLEAKSETYEFTRRGPGFRLTADKGVDWAFDPAA